jgi:hypothetical protein
MKSFTRDKNFKRSILIEGMFGENNDLIQDNLLIWSFKPQDKERRSKKAMPPHNFRPVASPFVILVCLILDPSLACISSLLFIERILTTFLDWQNFSMAFVDQININRTCSLHINDARQDREYTNLQIINNPIKHKGLLKSDKTMNSYQAEGYPHNYGGGGKHRRHNREYSGPNKPANHGCNPRRQNNERFAQQSSHQNQNPFNSEPGNRKSRNNDPQQERRNKKAKRTFVGNNSPHWHKNQNQNKQHYFNDQDFPSKSENERTFHRGYAPNPQGGNPHGGNPFQGQPQGSFQDQPQPANPENVFNSAPQLPQGFGANHYSDTDGEGDVFMREAPALEYFVISNTIPSEHWRIMEERVARLQEVVDSQNLEIIRLRSLSYGDILPRHMPTQGYASPYADNCGGVQ